MRIMLSRVTLVTLLVGAAACGDALDAPDDGRGPPPTDAASPHDASSDAARPDARPLDAMPDARVVVDLDHDGHPADADCDDADPAVFAQVTGFLDADGDGLGDGI